MSGHYDEHQRQDAAAALPPSTSAAPASAPSHGGDRGTANIIQRKPVAGASSDAARASPSAVPQHSLSVSSAGQEGYTVSPASSIHRDKESHTAETQYQEVFSPVSLRQQSQSSPEIPSPPTVAAAAAVTSYPRQWQQPQQQVQRGSEIGTGNLYGSPLLQRVIGTKAGAVAGYPVGQSQPQPTLLPPLQRQSSIQRPEPEPAREIPSWVGLRRPMVTNELYPTNTGNGSTTERQRQWTSELQQELAEARARETLMGHGPRVVSYGPAPPVEGLGVAPTAFSVPALYPGSPVAPSATQTYGAAATTSTSGISWQPQPGVNPPVPDLNKTLPQQPHHLGSHSRNITHPAQAGQAGTRDMHLESTQGVGGSTNENTKINTTMTQEKKRSPFMHYEDIDYFGPEPDDTDLDSPDIEMEQEKLKFAEAQFRRFSGDDSSRGKGKQATAVVTETGSAITPPAAATVSGGSNNNNVGYYQQLTNASGTAGADVLQMGVKARRSWERQQRRQAKARRQHQNQQPDQRQSPSHITTTTLGTGRPHAIDMIMRIPSLISSAGRGGGGSSVFGGGSNDNNSRSGDGGGTVDGQHGNGNGYLRPGEGGLANNNPYYTSTHDYTNEPLRTGGIRSSHHSSNRTRRSNGSHRASLPPHTHPHKPANIPPSPSNNNNQALIYAWLPEMLYSILSIGALIAIFLTLRVFDGQSIEPNHWPISPAITLNTLIAFLTAICQLSLLIPITRGLAQLKWNWFARAAPSGIPVPGRERSLGDFGLFDDAAFGTGTGRWGTGWPFGAVRLLFSGKGRTLGVGACLVLLTGWLAGPFTQGAVGYRMGEVPVEGDGVVARVNRGETYFLTSSSSGGENIVKREKLSGTSNQYQDPGVSQRRAIQQGIHYYTYSTATRTTNGTSFPAIPLLPQLPPHCSTPSCRFPLFSSLAICVDTIDLSSQLTISNLSTASGRTPLATAFDFLGFMPDSNTNSVRNASLPNGAYLLGSPGTCNLNITSPSPLPGASGGDRRPVDTNTFPLPTNTTTLGFANQPHKLSASIANLFVIYTNQTSNPKDDEEANFSAIEVLFHFCVNTYNVSVTQGIPTSEVVNSTTSVEQITDNDGIRVLHLRDSLSFDSNINIHQTTSASGSFSVNLTATQILQTQLVSLIGGTYSSSYGQLMKGLTPASEVLGAAIFDLDLDVGKSSSSSSAAVSTGAGNGSDGGERQQKTIGNFMQNVATSLTNALRASSSSSPTTEHTNTTTTKREKQTAGEADGISPIIIGTPLLPTAQIVIHYAPMTFLSVQVFLSAAFLVGIIVQTAVWGVPVLKGSSVDTLMAISSRDRAVLEEEEQAIAVAGKEMGRKRQIKRQVNLRLVQGPVGSTPGNGERAKGGWYLDTSGDAPRGSNHDNSLGRVG